MICTRFLWTRKWGKEPLEGGPRRWDRKRGMSRARRWRWGGAVADGAAGPLEPGQRWTVTRKREVVLRVMRGESVEALSRELGVESYRIQDWYERAMAGVDTALRERNGGDPLERLLKRAQSKVGELTMMNELYQERLRRIEHRPFDPRRSRK